MRKRSKFEDLIVWQKARLLAVDAYRLVRSSSIASDYPFRDQIQRAVISIAANIAEGTERGNTKECAYFFRVAKASASELRSHLILACDIGLCPPASAEPLHDEIRQIGSMLATLIQRQT